MVEYLWWSGAAEAPRKARFPDQFTDDLTTLVNNVTSEIISRSVLYYNMKLIKILVINVDRRRGWVCVCELCRIPDTGEFLVEYK